MIGEVIMFLEGRIDRLIPDLTRKMHEAVPSLRKRPIPQSDSGSETLAEKQKIVRPCRDQDYVGYARYGELACVQVFFVRSGKLIGRDHFLLECAADEEESEILRAFLQQYYEEASYVPREVLTPVPLPEPEVLEGWLGSLRGRRVYLRTPQRGAKKQLLDLAMKNAQIVLDETRTPSTL